MREAAMKGILLALTAGVASSAQAQNAAGALPANAIDAVARAIPGAKIVGNEDIDAQSCGSLPKGPGFVAADFNGDKRVDFAVLLKVRETGKTTDWNGKKFKETEFAFAVFVDDGKGGFKKVYIQRFSDLTPISAYIDLTPAGIVPGIGSNPSLTLKNPGVSLASCEKSEAVYYLSGDRVRVHWVSD